MRHSRILSIPSRTLTVLTLLTAISAVTGRAQETRATLSGTVMDPTGAAIAAANVQLINVETGVEFRTQSNQAGQYRFLFLNPGSYRLTAETPGFRAFTRDGIVLSTGQAPTLDVQLQLGSQVEKVTVLGEVPLIEAEKADRGMVVSRTNLAELPTITRVPILLVTLAPGVTNSSTRYDWTPFSNSGLSSWSINGSRSNSTGFLMDGAPNEAIMEGVRTIAYVPSTDSVQEFRVVANSYDAQYGRHGGGVISVVTKGGTNEFHGGVYEYLKRPALNATSFSNNARGLPSDNTPLDQYGFTIGGPVVVPKVYTGKNRTFFFSSWERFKQNQMFPQNDTSSVPTIEQRRGDFSKTFTNAGELIRIYDPATGRMVGNQWVRDPFPGNIIPPSRIDPVGAKIVSLYPAPNHSTPGSVDWQNNYFLKDNVTTYDFYNVAARIDHNFSDMWRIYGRYVWNDMLMHQNSNGLEGPAADLREGNKINKAFIIDSLTVLSPSATFNLRASVNRWIQNYRPTTYGTYNGTTIGWPQSLVSRFGEPNLMPRISMDQYKVMGPGSGNVWYVPTTTLAIAPTLTAVMGRHSLKFGLDYRRIGSGQWNPVDGSGSLTFNRTFTRSNYLNQDALSGSAIASALLGYAASGSVSNVNSLYYRWGYVAPWIQDDIKLTRRLSVNAGLRWDVQMPVTEMHNRMNRGFFADRLNPISSRIDQSAFPNYKVYGGIGFAGADGLSRSPYSTDWNNIQPRLGAAFQLTPSTVLRGGWGISYAPDTSTGRLHGFNQSTPYVATTDAGRTSANVVSNPFPSGILQPSGARSGLETLLGQGPSFADPSGIISYVHNFSFGVQRVLPGKISVDVSYVGSRTMNAATSRAFNYISEQNRALGDSTTGGNPNYLTAAVPNPFAGLIPGTSLNSATVTRQQLLRPYPQFTGFDVVNYPNGRIWYNALQITVEKRYSHGLTFTGSYAFAKNLEALTYLNEQDELSARSLTSFDRSNRLTIAPLYEFPFGPGRAILGNSRGVVRHLVAGWQAILNTTFMGGVPMSTPGGVWLLADPRLENATWDRMFKTGYIDANGVVRNVLPGEQPVFQVQPPFTRNTSSPYFPNLRNRWANEYNFTLVKKFTIRENMNAQFRAEALNLTNTPIFPGNPNLSVTSANFGKLFRENGQTNVPRQIMLALRFNF